MPEIITPQTSSDAPPALSPIATAATRVTKFEELARLPDDEIDVALGAAMIARDEYARLDVDALLAKLDALAAPLAAQKIATLPVAEQAARISAYLFEEIGFRGNDEDYYDPKNSFLSDVLDRKTGIPITLALVYSEVAKRCGVNAHGVGFPGHFLVRIDEAGFAPHFRADSDAVLTSATAMIDPFFGGRLLDRDGLTKLLHRVTSDGSLRAEHLAPTPPRAILVRMLTNLKSVHSARGDYARVLLVLDRLLSLMPNKVDHLRERGLAAARLGAYSTATSDLRRVLELDPRATDARDLRAQIARWNAKPRAMN